MTRSDPAASLLEHDLGPDFSQARMQWLVRLRWVAMAGVLGAAGLAYAGFYPGVAWPVLVATSAVGAAYNFLLWRSRRSRLAGWRGAMAQAVIDLSLLTVALWASGGVETPFVAYYVFHVALVGILGGPRATVLAAGTSIGFAGLLWLSELWPAARIGAWDPGHPWDVLADVAAFVTTVAAAAYIVTHAMRELRDRERALARARDRASLEYQVLSNTLDELEAGLEVVELDGRTLWRNKRAEELAPFADVGEQWRCPGADRACEKDASGVCPVHHARDNHEPGRCRFAVPYEDGERVYEMMVFPLPAGEEGDRQRTMNLYVDRTQATLAERRLIIAERLASLGRVAQGVAHELNTPLATIRTLATDMRAALREIAAEAEQIADLDESAELIHDETRRLGRITQALLAGGDLVRAKIDNAVPLSAAVERARALVFAGVRRGPEIDVGEGVESLSVHADPDRLIQVLVNLLQNAYDAVRGRDDGHVRVRAHLDGGAVCLEVVDDGPGIDPSIQSRLFEPFATTKPPGEGTGLGLYTSYMLVRTMGGSLSLERRESGGTRAIVRLPAAPGLENVVTLGHRAAG